ncbi:MAG: cupredoxin domain-containing protein, partial [Nitrososphaera sp.]
NILEGASVQGSPDYDPDNLTAKKGDQVTVVNQDTVPHTATAGTGPQDPNSAKLFDTSIINPSESATISLAQANPGEVDFYCMIHPYMTGKITVG